MITAQMVKDLRETTGAGMLDCKKALDETNGNMEAAIDYLREKGIAKASKKADRIAAEGLTLIKVKADKAVILEVNSETDFVAQNEEFISLIETIAETLLNNKATTIEAALDLKTDGTTINDLIIAKTSKIGEKLSLRRFEVVNKKDTENFGAYLHKGGRISSLVVVDNASEEVAKDVAMHAAAMKPTHVKISDVTEEELEREKKVLKEQAINEGKPADIAEKMVVGRINKFYKDICLEEQPFIKDSDKSVKAYVKENGGTIISMIRYEVGEGLEKRACDFAEEVMKQVNN